MPLEPGKPLQQQKVEPGTVLFQSGQAASMLCLLHKGEVGIQIPGHKTPAYRLGDNTCPGFAALLRREKYETNFVVTKPSVISAFPVKRDQGFQGLVLGKLNVAMLAVRTVAQEIMQSLQAIKQMEDFSAYLQKTLDNMALAYYRCNPQVFQNQIEAGGESFVDPVVAAARIVVDSFQEHGGEIPESLNRAWLEADHSQFLDRTYDFESSVDQDSFQLYRRILSLPANVQGAMYKADLQILQGVGIRLTDILGEAQQDLRQLFHGIKEGMESLVQGEYCFAEKYFMLSDLARSGITNVSAPEFAQVIRWVHDTIARTVQNYKSLMGGSLPDITPSVQKIEEFLKEDPAAKAVEEQAQKKAARAGADMDAIKKDLQGSAGKILSFIQMPNDESKKLIEDPKELKKVSNPLDSSPELRKLRRGISTLYWKAYEKAFFKFRESNGNVPRPVRLMLDYGFFDEELLDDNHLEFIYDLQDTSRANKIYPVMYSREWIDQVGSRKEPPSIDEMGQTYFEKLKQENKEKGWKRESDLPEEYTNFNVLAKYELHNFLETNVKLTSGSPASAFPILTKYDITIDLDKSFVTRERISEALDKLLSIDYSAFHREVLINDEEKGILKEFVQTRVIPNFIIVPSIGTKIMMWQELALSRLKGSKGRIAVPVFATADFFTLLLEAVAAFRWELTKTILGADWNNIANSSLTADYTDYIQFFKKNRELSQEAKEKLAAELKRYRGERNMFVNDYTNWVRYESEGVMKLNKVARAILYRHVPFSKAVRDGLANQPAFSELQNRLTNIRKKKLHELEIKYRKYGEPGSLPEVLEENLNFYRV